MVHQTPVFSGSLARSPRRAGGAARVSAILRALRHFGSTWLHWRVPASMSKEHR
jgi:hypothetical protein